MYEVKDPKLKKEDLIKLSISYSKGSVSKYKCYFEKIANSILKGNLDSSSMAKDIGISIYTVQSILRMGCRIGKFRLKKGFLEKKKQ